MFISTLCISTGHGGLLVPVGFETTDTVGLFSLSSRRIPDSVGKDIEKACQSIYPLHDVYVRKVKMLKKPKFECK